VADAVLAATSADDPGTSEPALAPELADTELADTEPADTESAETEYADTESAETEYGDAESAETESARAQDEDASAVPDLSDVPAAEFAASFFWPSATADGPARPWRSLFR
jgi:hypothetical protein